MICRHCGAEVPDWMDFCPKCMKTVDRAESAKAPEKAAPAPAPAVQRTRKPEAEPEMVDDEASAVFEDEGYIEEMGEEAMEILYPEMGDFSALYNEYAYRSLDEGTLDFVNTLWESLKIN